MIEVIVIGGVILGLGIGLIIRHGGALDGTEILALIINRSKGFTVGQVILFLNIFIFIAVGIVFRDWCPAFQSLMIYLIVVKVMDMVIVGLEETKAVTIISTRPKEVSDALIHKLQVGLTIINGRGGFSGKPQDILYIIAERLQLAEVKELVHDIDPQVAMALEGTRCYPWDNRSPIIKTE